MESEAPTVKRTRGRQKTTMAKIANLNNLQVTFSKRRAGLFKKASELCTLSGAEAAVIVFSPANKAYCFGHPNVQTLMERFHGGNDPSQSDPVIEAHRNSTIRELNSELTQLESLLKMEKRRSEELELIRKMGRIQQWIPVSTEEIMNVAQLKNLEESIRDFERGIDHRVQKELLLLTDNNQLPLYQENANSFVSAVHQDISSYPPVESNYCSYFTPGGFSDVFATGINGDHGVMASSAFHPMDGMFPVDDVNNSFFHLENSGNLGFGFDGGFGFGQSPSMF